MTFKPMLAGKAPEDLSKLRYPVLASPKLDGIRCIIWGGVAMSRNMKPIPNRFVQQQLAGLPDGLDGELMLSGGFNACQSEIMSADGEPDFTYFVFDWYGAKGYRCLAIETDLEFSMRLRCVTESTWPVSVKPLEHLLIHDTYDLLNFQGACLASGFEGVMVRDPEGPYKYGRSTTREGYLLKIKSFEDEEAVVIGVVEREHNDNEKKRDELGRAKRSSAKAGKRPAGDLGALVCITRDGVEFQIGSGFTAEQRVQYWSQRDCLPGQTVKFRHQPDPGGRKFGRAPRFPVFEGFRHQDDMS